MDCMDKAFYCSFKNCHQVLFKPFPDHAYERQYSPSQCQCFFLTTLQPVFPLLLSFIDWLYSVLTTNPPDRDNTQMIFLLCHSEDTISRPHFIKLLFYSRRMPSNQWHYITLNVFVYSLLQLYAVLSVQSNIHPKASSQRYCNAIKKTVFIHYSVLCYKTDSGIEFGLVNKNPTCCIYFPSGIQ